MLGHASSGQRWIVGSKVLVIWPAAAFRGGPCDDFVGILDVASLAVDAVGGVDLEALAGVVIDDFVDAGGAEARAGIVVFHGTRCNADVRVGNLQVDLLVLIVLGGGEVVIDQTIVWRPGALSPVAIG